MRIVIGSDHAGFPLKEEVRELQGRQVMPTDGDLLQEIIEIDYQI